MINESNAEHIDKLSEEIDKNILLEIENANPSKYLHELKKEDSELKKNDSEIKIVDEKNENELKKT